MDDIDEGADDQDYYGFFNIPRNCSQDEVIAAYRRLSRMYHPDRHANASLELRKLAEKLFLKTKRGYEVLIDPQKRVIYDTIGPQGLEHEQSWELVERTFGATEIREEYERLLKLKEEQLLQQRTNPSGSFAVTVNATDWFNTTVTADDEFDMEDYIDILPEISSVNMTQSVEAPISQKDRLILGGTVGANNGRGSGAIMCAWRRLISPVMWGEAQIGVGDSTTGTFKLVRTFSRHMFGQIQMTSKLSRDGIHGVIQAEQQPYHSGTIRPIPGDFQMIPGVTKQLHKHYTGTIGVSLGGMPSGVTTRVVYDDALKHRIVGSLMIGKPWLTLACNYTYRFSEDDAKLKLSLKWPIGYYAVIADIAYERQISKYSFISVSCHTTALKRLELRFRLSRASQSYQLNVVLCEQEILPSTVVWGVLAPLVLYQMVKFAVRPFWDSHKLKLLQEKQEKTSNYQALQRHEVEATIELMRSAAEQIRDDEEKKKGLIIVEAWYGKICPEAISPHYSLLRAGGTVIEVTLPLQALVRDSRLVLQPYSKVHLPGFFDCSPGEVKRLLLVYKYQDVVQRMLIADMEGINIPSSVPKKTK